MIKRGQQRLVVGLLLIFAVLLVITIGQQLVPQPEPTVPPGFTLTRVWPELTLDNVAAVRLRAPGTDISLIIARGNDGTWVAPDRAGVLDEAAAQNIVGTMILLPYRRTLPLAPEATLDEYGLAQGGLLAAEVLLADGGAHAVLIGSMAASGEVFYGLVDDLPDLYLLERDAVSFLLVSLRQPPIA